MCLLEKRKAWCKVQKLSQQQMSDAFSKKKKIIYKNVETTRQKLCLVEKEFV